MALTSGVKLEIRQGDRGAYTTLTDDVNGLGSFNLQPGNRQSRPVPNTRQVLVTQLLQYRNGNLSFTCDANAVTHPLFFMRSGQRFDFRITREDGVSGTPVRAGSGVATVNYNSAVGGIRSFQVNIPLTELAETSV